MILRKLASENGMGEKKKKKLQQTYFFQNVLYPLSLSHIKISAQSKLKAIADNKINGTQNSWKGRKHSRVMGAIISLGCNWWINMNQINA